MKTSSRTAFLMACALALTLGACGGSTDDAADAAATDVVEEQATTSTSTDDATALEDVEVMTYEQYMAADVDDPVVIEAYVQATQAWWDDTASIYAADEDGAYFVYGAACTEADYDKLVEGQKIKVSGYKAEWSGEVEIVEGTIEILDGTWVSDPVDVTEILGTNELIDYQNQKVSVAGLTVEPSVDADGNEVAFLYNYDGSGAAGENDDLYFNVSVNGETYTFTVESYLSDESSEVYETVTNLAVGDTIDVEGFLYWYEGPNPHVTSVTVL